MQWPQCTLFSYLVHSRCKFLLRIQLCQDFPALSHSPPGHLIKCLSALPKTPIQSSLTSLKLSALPTGEMKVLPPLMPISIPSCITCWSPTYIQCEWTACQSANTSGSLDLECPPYATNLYSPAFTFSPTLKSTSCKALDLNRSVSWISPVPKIHPPTLCFHSTAACFIFHCICSFMSWLFQWYVGLCEGRDDVSFILLAFTKPAMVVN